MKFVYNNTAYYNGMCRRYPSISGLKSIIKEICNAKSTTEYIRITPFYKNSKVNGQIELDEDMFYIECRSRWVTKKDAIEHIAACIGVDKLSLTKEQIRVGKLQYPLCSFDDVDCFVQSLKNYERYLCEVLIPKRFNYIIKNYKSVQNNLAFGNFEFEIHSE